MVGTNDNRKTRRIELRGQLRQRTTNGVYSYRLTVANGTRKEFFLRTSNYDEADRHDEHSVRAFVCMFPV